MDTFRLPTIYVDNKLTRVNVGNTQLIFSYETLVAFVRNGETFCRQNDWSNTTGKHLNAIEPDKAKRLNTPAFVLAVNSELSHLFSFTE